MVTGITGEWVMPMIFLAIAIAQWQAMMELWLEAMLHG